jgi:dethiobiotin synthetase
MSFFITATDTGAGKTYVTALLLRALRAEGCDAVGYKPVSCGDRDDAVTLVAAGGHAEPMDAVNPLWYSSAVAPYVAGLLESRPLDPAGLLAGYRSLAARHEIVLVEGVGGWEVPLAPGYGVPDLAADLGLPVLLVVSNKLGALNHTILTVKAIQARGLACAGLVFNNAADELDTAAITNKGVIEDLCGIPVLTDIIRGQEDIEVEGFLALLGRG